MNLLGTYLEKNMIQKDTRTPVFIAALFTVVKTWKQHSINRGMDEEEMIHIYNGILLIHKKE